MREIKFRGQRTDNKQWVYGYYFKTPLTDEATGSKPEDGWSFLAGRERHCISQNSCVYEVIPETVGQHTGLKDKNGVEIYEGDLVVYDDYNGQIYWSEDRAMFELEYDDSIVTDFDHIYSKELEIISNIYENPELLEVSI